MVPFEEIRDREIKRAQANPFPKYNHIVLKILEKDHTEMYVDLTPDSMNYMGTVHGGLYFTLADFCGATCARTDGRLYVTSQAESHFLRTVNSGRITARSRIVHRGRLMCLVEVEVTDEEGNLLYKSSITMFCVGEDDPRAGIGAAEGNDGGREAE